MRPYATRALSAPLIVACLAATGCASDREAGGGPEILLAAAASLSTALPALVEAFEQETGVRVVVTTGASGQLAQQILEGAPVDVFASADRAWVERLGQAGRIVPGTDAVYARGALVFFQPEDGVPVLDELTDLADERIRRIAIANPESAPYGRAARQALEAAGLWTALEARIVIAENVRQTVQYVETGGVDVAFTSAALMREGVGRWLPVPPALYAPLDQSLAVIADRPHVEEARMLATFLLGSRGQEILARYGFLPPGG